MLDAPHSARHTKSIPSIILEVAMIVVGVFLGLMAEQWRQGRHEQELVQASLRNFRTEIRANQMQMQGVRAYHEALAQNIEKFMLEKTPHTFTAFRSATQFQGMRPVELEHTAWDLALATQALSYMKPEMAYAISRLYTGQQAFQTLENSFLQSAFTPTVLADTSNATGLALSMGSYLGDVNIQEPGLLRAYGIILPRIDSALGDPASNHTERSYGSVVP